MGRCPGFYATCFLELVDVSKAGGRFENDAKEKGVVGGKSAQVLGLKTNKRLSLVAGELSL